MDEPFGALDAITRGRLQEELLRIQRETGKTILFVTHDVEEAFRLGSQVVVMDQGHLMQEGAPVELLARPANAFVGQLVGSANALRQFEYLPATAAREASADPAAPGVAASTTLLDALLRLMQTGQPALNLEEDGRVTGQVTLAGIARVVSAARATAASQASAGAETPASAGEAVEASAATEAV